QPFQPPYNLSPSKIRKPCSFQWLATILRPAGLRASQQVPTSDGGRAWTPTVSEPGLLSPRFETPDDPPLQAGDGLAPRSLAGVPAFDEVRHGAPSPFWAGRPGRGRWGMRRAWKDKVVVITG